MPSTNWEHIAGILAAAQDLPGAEREEFIARVCGGDDTLLARVRALLSDSEALAAPSLLTDQGTAESVSTLTISTVDFHKPDELIGQFLDGRYLIVKNLIDDGADRGGIGLVYLASQVKLMGRNVVVKILQEESLKNDEGKRKFLHEQEALILVKHPNIVSILDAGTLPDGNPFIVMEYISGYSLRKLLDEKKKLPLELTAHIIESVTRALGAAHSAKILHRDIKPENIMLTPQEGHLDHVHLIDFGIARVAESKLAPVTSVKGLMGTPRYMAPEQLAGEIDLTCAVDIYAIAIMAYELLTGEIPFKAKSLVEMFNLEKAGVKVPPRRLRPDLSTESEKILLSALEFDAAKRPQDAIAFGREFARSLKSDGVVEADRAELSTIKQNNFVEPPSGGRTGLTRWLIVGTLLAALSVPAGYFLINGLGSPGATNQPNSNPGNESPIVNAGPNSAFNKITGNINTANGQDAVNEPERELSYFLTVQKRRNGKPFEAPFRSSGKEIYESGYGFTMTFQPDADGYMYILNEGKDKQGETGYYLLFPTPTANNGSAQVSGGKEISTAGNTFSGGRGTEIVWMIWTKQKQDDLETITSSVTVPPGTVKNENRNLLRSFLEKYRSEKTESLKDSINQRSIVKAQGDIVTHRFELEHR